MGGTNQEALTFLNVSCGKFINKKKELSYDGYLGKLVKIAREEDEYEGKPVPKVKIRLEDTVTGEVAQISFSFESWFSVGFFQRIEKIDLSKPFHVGVYGSKTNEKISFCWMKQGAKIEKDETLPEPKKVVVGRQTVTDWTEFAEKAEKVVLDLTAKLAAMVPAEAPVSATAPAKEESDLPF